MENLAFLDRECTQKDDAFSFIALPYEKWAADRTRNERRDTNKEPSVAVPVSFEPTSKNIVATPPIRWSAVATHVSSQSGDQGAPLKNATKKRGKATRRQRGPKVTVRVLSEIAKHPKKWAKIQMKRNYRRKANHTQKHVRTTIVNNMKPEHS